ncbi:MAG: phage replisome organizer N-terminal domain-containing protein [Lachnospiraceae bacterium]|nr:phage replisome organizer N-terminal domain-containing protein [Lachnospiraceae bacterium]
MINVKLPVSFFDEDKIKAMRFQKDGNTAVLVYLMLLLTAIKSENDGKLMLCDGVPHDEAIISSLYNFPSKQVKDALELLAKFGLLTQEDGIYCISQYETFLDKDELKRQQNAKRQQRYAAKKKEETMISGRNDAVADASITKKNKETSA